MVGGRALVAKPGKVGELWRAAVIDLCDGLAAELTTGSAPEEALDRAVAFLEPSITRTLTPLRNSADIPAGLELIAATPGAEGLRLLAACWRIGVERGGAFASVADGLASALRDEETHRQQVSAELAGARATAELLAVLPLLGIAMAAALGAQPLTFLFTTLPGWPASSWASPWTQLASCGPAASPRAPNHDVVHPSAPAGARQLCRHPLAVWVVAVFLGGLGGTRGASPSHRSERRTRLFIVGSGRRSADLGVSVGMES